VSKNRRAASERLIRGGLALWKKQLWSAKSTYGAGAGAGAAASEKNVDADEVASESDEGEELASGLAGP